jgi:hypothetical protein
VNLASFSCSHDGEKRQPGSNVELSQPTISVLLDDDVKIFIINRQNGSSLRRIHSKRTALHITARQRIERHSMTRHNENAVMVARQAIVVISKVFGEKRSMVFERRWLGDNHFIGRIRVSE